IPPIWQKLPGYFFAGTSAGTRVWKKSKSLPHSRLELEAEVGIGLQARRHFRAGAKVAREPQSGVGRDAALFRNDFIDAAWPHVQRPRQRVLRQPTRLHKFFAQYLARMNRG